MAEILGTNVNDSLTGTWVDDRILGFAGNDKIDGQGGADFLDGGDGDDTLFGQGGEDYLVGEYGNDYLYGGSGDDLLGGGWGNDTCWGAEGLDTIYGDAGNDCLSGGYNDALYGGEGNDLILFDVFSESNFAGVFGLAEGGNGNDTISYKYGLDSPTFNGGPGTDLLKLDFDNLLSTGVQGDLTKMLSHSLRPYHLLVLSGFEVMNVTGSYSNDVITGGALGDTIFGRDGDDTINGGDGSDSLSGGDGLNWVSGGNGNDSLYAQSDQETLAGDRGNDFYEIGWPGPRVVEMANSGVDRVSAACSYVLPANVENLELIFELGGFRYISGTGNNLGNRIAGNTDSNELRGGAGNDIVLGYGGNDNQLGGTGWDSLDGGAGSDMLTGANLAAPFGSLEIDTLTGGADGDEFVLGVAASVLYNNTVEISAGLADYALITDFTPGQLDKLQLKGSAAQYFLGNSPLAGVTGRALYHDSNANGTLQTGTDELIAIIRSPVALTAANTIGTAVFV